MKFFRVIFLLSATLVWVQEPAGTTAAQAPNRDTGAYIDENGTAHITRVIPVPQYISPEAQTALARRVPDATRSASLEERRARMVEVSARSAATLSKICATRTSDGEIAGLR